MYWHVYLRVNGTVNQYELHGSADHRLTEISGIRPRNFDFPLRISSKKQIHAK